MTVHVELQIWNQFIKCIPPIKFTFDRLDDNAVARIYYLVQRGMAHARPEGSIGVWISEVGEKCSGQVSPAINPEVAYRHLADRLEILGADLRVIGELAADAAHEIDDTIDNAITAAIRHINNKGIDFDKIPTVVY